MKRLTLLALAVMVASLATISALAVGGEARGAAVVDRYLYLTDAEIAEIRDGIVTQPWSAQAWRQLRAAADTALGKIPEPPDADLDFRADGRIGGSCPPRAAGWNCALYQPGMRDGRAAYTLALVGRVTGDARYIAAAKRILFAWVGTYDHPPANVGHMVAEPVGPMIKLFVTADLLRAELTDAERADVANWARQWIAVGQRAADSARDQPWVPDVTLGGRSTNVAAYGNSPFGERAMAVWAAAVAGEPYLSGTLAWNWQHATSDGADYGWRNLLDGMFIRGGRGETVEGRVRSSVGYGLFGWAELLLIADVAAHAGAQPDLFTAESPGGESLLGAAEFYGPLIAGDRPSPYSAPETFGSGNYSETRTEYRAVFETAFRNCPAGNRYCAAFARAIAAGGDAARGDAEDLHFLRWRAILGMSTSGQPSPPNAGQPPVPAEPPPPDQQAPDLTQTLPPGDRLGSTTDSGSWMRSGVGYRFGSIFRLDAPAEASAFTWRAAGGPHDQSFTPLVYRATDGGAPAELVAVGADVSIRGGQTPAWVTVPLRPTALVPGRYLLALASGGADAGALTGVRRGVPGAGLYDTNGARTSSSWSAVSREDVEWSFSLALSPAAAPQPIVAPPTATEPPTVSGIAEDGATLAAATGTWSGDPALTIAWERCGSTCEPTGVTTAEYAVGPADVGSTLRVQVRAENAAGVGAAASTATDVVLARNLAPNPSFEEDPAASYYVNGIGMFEWTSDLAHSGSRSLMISGAQSTGFARWMTQPKAITAEPGRAYDVSAWIRSDGRTARGVVAVTFWRADWTFIGAAEVDGTAGCERRTWCYASFRPVAPSAAAYARLEVRLSGDGSIWADDVGFR